MFVPNPNKLVLAGWYGIARFLPPPPQPSLRAPHPIVFFLTVRVIRYIPEWSCCLSIWRYGLDEDRSISISTGLTMTTTMTMTTRTRRKKTSPTRSGGRSPARSSSTTATSSTASRARPRSRSGRSTSPRAAAAAAAAMRSTRRYRRLCGSASRKG